MINIIVVDDQHLVLTGICAILELNPNFSIKAQISDSSQVIEFLNDLQPDILLLDIRMPKVDGLQILKAMKEQQLQIPTLVLTTFDEHELVLQCLQLGAMGYLRKDISLEELSKAIQMVHSGERWIQPAITQQLKSNYSYAESNDTQYEKLTDGEVQVLRLIAAGFSNNEIADALHKSPGRIRNIVTLILEKLMVRDRTQAALKGLELGLI